MICEKMNIKSIMSNVKAQMSKSNNSSPPFEKTRSVFEVPL